MNVKFKMPKFGRVLTGKTFLKELGLTILATTISIILTFGTAHLIEKSQKKQAGRQAAMMVIHDIDESVEMMRDMAKSDVDNFELTQYAIDHLDSIASFSADTLYIIYQYLCESGEFQIQDTKEKIFHSSQDSWKNIDNAQFLDVAQNFYYERNYYQDYFNGDFYFKKPLTREKQYETFLAHAPSFELTAHFPQLIRQCLQDQKVLFYLMSSPYRSRTYNAIADAWKQMSDRCKFIMGITEEEMDEYVKKKDRRGHAARKRELLGKWTATSSEDSSEEMEFLDDMTFTHTTIVKSVTPFYRGRLSVATTLRGTWSIEGDSLIRQYATKVTTRVDKSQITFAPEMKDSVERFIAHSEQQSREEWEKMLQSSQLQHYATTAYIDDSGDKFEMVKTIVVDEGDEKEYAVYMTRVKK